MRLFFVKLSISATYEDPTQRNFILKGVVCSETAAEEIKLKVKTLDLNIVLTHAGTKVDYIHLNFMPANFKYCHGEFLLLFYGANCPLVSADLICKIIETNVFSPMNITENISRRIPIYVILYSETT